MKSRIAVLLVALPLVTSLAAQEPAVSRLPAGEPVTVGFPPAADQPQTLTALLKDLDEPTTPAACPPADPKPTQSGSPTMAFDSKGVDMGPWIRRFISQVRRNWMVPRSAMSCQGNVELTFIVHRDGTIADVAVSKPSNIESFNRASRQAIIASSPAGPIPEQYPDETMKFAVTFFYERPSTPSSTGAK
jgi:TonB family protein